MWRPGGVVAYVDPFIQQVATLGLGATPDSVAYYLAEIEKHFHNSQQVYGGTSAGAAGDPTFVRRSTTPFTVTGGNSAWGEERILHNGTVIEGGSSTMKFDLHKFYITAVGATNNITILEFITCLVPVASAVACTFTAATNKVNKVAHGLLNNDKVCLVTIASNTGINIYTNYYVVNRGADDFELSLTRAGATVDITGVDGAGSYYSLGATDAEGIAAQQTLCTEVVASKNTANPDVLVQPMMMPRQLCNRRIACRGKATGATNAISFLLGLHTYSG